MRKKVNSLVFVIIASVVFAVVTLSTMFFTSSSVNAGCGNRPGTPNEVRAEPSPDSPTSAIRFSWRNTTGRAHSGSSHTGYFDIYITDENGQPLSNLTGYGPYNGISYGSRSFYDITGLSPGSKRCFSLRARTGPGTQGCISEIASASACATTLATAPPQSVKSPQPRRILGKRKNSSTPIINTELTLIPGSFNQLRVSGGVFAAGEEVSISVTTLINGQNPSTVTTPTTADSSGRINQTIGVTCVSGSTSVFQAQARGVSSGKVSNISGASC